MRKGLTVGGVLTVAACALAWLFLAPAKLGGHTTYVVTHGVSMEPRFHTGDLAVLRTKAAYHVGDVAAYRSTTLQTVVMHRIVAENAGQFTFKGDNNSWFDPDHPTQADVLGALELQVPGGGRYLTMLHSTPGFAIAGGLLALLLLGGTTKVRRRRALRTSRGAGRHRAGKHRAVPPPSGRAARRSAPPTIVLPEPNQVRSNSPVALVSEIRTATALSQHERHPLPAGARGQLVGAALLLVACLGGEAWLATLSATVPTTRTAVINQTGTFGYSAKVPASVVYPTGKLAAGDPIFTQIVHSADFSFDYQADAKVTGTVGLSAALVSANGWTTPLATAPVTLVRGGSGHATVRVDITAAQAALDRFTAATGVKATSASLVITPEVRVTGSVASQVITGDYSGELTLGLGASQLSVVSTSANQSPAAGGPVNPLVVTSPIDAKVPATVPRTLAVAGRHIGIPAARIVTGAGVAVALGWLIAVLVGSRRTGRAEDDVISALRQYGDRIVDAESIPLDGPVVDLTSLAALHSVAERYDRVILHTVRGERHSYVVRDELSWYRYDLRPERGAHAAPRKAERTETVGVEGSVISLEPRRHLVGVSDILPGGVGPAAWADGYARAS